MIVNNAELGMRNAELLQNKKQIYKCNYSEFIIPNSELN